MLAVVCRDNGLRKRSLEEPAFLNPLTLKSRIHAFEVRQKLLQDFFVGHLEKWIIHGSIVAKIDEVPTAIFGGWLVIGMLNKAGKRIAWIAGIDPIAICKLTIKGEDEALRTICLPPVITSTIIVGQCWYETTGQAGSHGRDNTISRPGSLVGLNFPVIIIDRFRFLNTSTKQDFSTCLANTFH